jgi:hypothetical protein
MIVISVNTRNTSVDLFMEHTLDDAFRALTHYVWESDVPDRLALSYALRDVETGAVRAVGYFQARTGQDRPDLHIAGPFGIDVYRAYPNPDGGFDVVRVTHAVWARWDD